MTNFLYVLGGCLAFACVAFGLQCLVEMTLKLFNVRKIIGDLEDQIDDLETELDELFDRLMQSELELDEADLANGHMNDIVDQQAERINQLIACVRELEAKQQQYGRLFQFAEIGIRRLGERFQDQIDELHKTNDHLADYIEQQKTELDRFYLAMGHLSTLKGDMICDISNPEGMVQEIIDHVGKKGKKK